MESLQPLAINFEREPFWKALRLLAASSPVPAKKSAHRYTRLVRVDIDNNLCRMVTSSLSSCTVVHSLPCTAGGRASFVTVFDKLYSVVQTTGRTNITLLLDEEGRWIKVRCEGTAKLPLEEPTSFPDLAERYASDSTEPFIEDMEIASLSDSIQQIKPTICEDSSYVSIYGIFFDGNWVSTTGRYMTVHPSGYEWQGQFFVARELADVIPSLETYCKEMNISQIRLTLLGSHLRMDLGAEASHFVTLQAGTFADYKYVMDRVMTCNHRCRIATEPLKAALGRAAPFVDIWGSLRLQISDGQNELVLDLENQADAEHYTESLPVEAATANLDVLLRFEFFQQLVASCNSAHLTLFYEDGTKPLYTLSEDGTAVIIPPMRRV